MAGNGGLLVVRGVLVHRMLRAFPVQSATVFLEVVEELALREHEMGVRVVYVGGDLFVRPAQEG
jgi:hypothetical protein